MKFMINIASLFLIFLAFSAKAESFDKSISFDGVKRYGTDFGFEHNSHFYNNKFYWLYESPRVCQRLNNLRNWNYEKIKSLYIRIS